MDFAPAFEVLVVLARELTDHRARSEAVEGLGQRTEPGAVAALLDIVHGDPDEDIQREAVETLGDLPGRAGLSALAAIARGHASTGVRCEAAETYGACAEQQDAIAFLRDLAARDPHGEVRCEAVETIGQLHDASVVDVLTSIVDRSEDLDVQREAVETLGQTILGAAAAPALERIARYHALAEVQREAVETLGELHDESGRALVVVAAIAADHPDETVRAEAVETFGDNAPADQAEALCERLLRSESSKHVRHELRETLEELRED